MHIAQIAKKIKELHQTRNRAKEFKPDTVSEHRKGNRVVR